MSEAHQAARRRIYIATATLRQDRGLRTDIQGFCHVTFAASENEARGEMVRAAMERHPGHSIAGEAVGAVPDEYVLAAAQELANAR